jgi:DNA polymerase-3 subunit delta
LSAAPPVVYLLHGEDDFAIAQFVSEIEAKLGDAALAEMNTTRLDGKTFNLDELLSVAGAMPFLAKRRLVILSNPTSRIQGSTAQERFLTNLERIPATTALLLVEPRTLTEGRERKRGKQHWLERWAAAHPDFVYNREFPRLSGPELIKWIGRRAKQAGGQFTPQAGEMLAALVGDDPRCAEQEVHKLLAYVNYTRPVEPDDVALLTADIAHNRNDIFEMVKALALGDGRMAVALLHRLLEEQEPIAIFGMIVRQFRQLLQVRELLDADRGSEIEPLLKIYGFQATALIAQARSFTLADLEAIYRRLLDVDLAMKGEIDPVTALDTLIAALTRS